MHHSGTLNEEEAIRKMKSDIVHNRRQLLRLVLQEDSIVPRACKDLFWKMCKIVHMFYIKDDGFTSHDMMNVVNAVIQEPISLSEF